MNLRSVPLFGEPTPIVLACIFLLATGYLINLWLKPRNRVDLPLLGKTDDHKHDFQALVEEGARKVGPFATSMSLARLRLTFNEVSQCTI